jgi:hypothetical protein
MKQEVQLGDTGLQLVNKLKNNFDELYLGNSSGRYIIQATDLIGVSSWWKAGYVYIIRHNFDFGSATINLPAGIVLLFEGGIWSNGTIHGNNTIFTTEGLTQIFETSLTLTGTWKNAELFVQWYGAVTNENKVTYANSATVAIQKCFDSLFNVLIPNGFYYVATGLTISKPKRITLVGSYADFTTTGSLATYDKIISCIYTNNDINVVTIQASDVYWLDGLIDISGVTAFTKAAFRYDQSYNHIGGALHVSICGDVTSLIAGTNTGTGILFDTANATRGAESHYIDIKANLMGLKVGVWTQPANALSCYSSNLPAEVIAWYVKEVVRYEMGNYSTVKATVQCCHMLTALERMTTPLVYLRGYNICVDLSANDLDHLLMDTVAPYRAYWSIIDEGYFNKYINSSVYEVANNTVRTTGVKASSALIVPPYGLLYANNKRRTLNNSYISRLENRLAFAEKFFTTSIKKYDGSLKDFDNDLAETTGAETAGVTITDAASLYDPRGRATTIEHLNEATKHTDYVEIIISINGAPVYYFDLGQFHVAFNLRDNNFKRVQLIYFNHTTAAYVLHEDFVPQINYQPPPGTVHPLGRSSGFDLFEFGGYVQRPVEKIILRLIGVEYINLPYEIDDIIGTCYGFCQSPVSPLIDIGGGQAIFGDLTFSGGTPKLLSQPIHADNAAAKIAGLIDGDTYRTPAGQLMVVYT